MTTEATSTMFDRARDRYDLGRLVQEIQRRSEASVDFITDTRQLSVAPTGELEHHPEQSQLVREGSAEWFAANAALPINDYAHGQIAGETGVPKAYYDRMRHDAPELWAANVNHWLHAEPQRRMVRTTDRVVRSVLSERYHRLDNVDILAATLPTLADTGLQWRFQEAGLTDRRLYIRAVLWDRRGEVKKGDEVAAGFIIRNSEVGAGALAIEPFLHRLACVNGMVVAVGGIRKVHLGRAQENELSFLREETLRQDDKAFLMKVGDTLAGLVNPASFQKILDQARLAASIEVQNPIAAAELLTSRIGLREPEQERVLANLTRGGDLSVWGMLNALTATARDLSDYDRKIELETEAGKLMMAPAEVNALAKAA
jgi:hypothetical protein